MRSEPNALAATAANLKLRCRTKRQRWRPHVVFSEAVRVAQRSSRNPERHESLLSKRLQVSESRTDLGRSMTGSKTEMQGLRRKCSPRRSANKSKTTHRVRQWCKASENMPLNAYARQTTGWGHGPSKEFDTGRQSRWNVSFASHRAAMHSGSTWRLPKKQHLWQDSQLSQPPGTKWKKVQVQGFEVSR